MKDQVSETVKRVYPMSLILSVAGLSSAAYYRKKEPDSKKDRPGPKPTITDDQLLIEIRNEIRESPFLDEGYKKTWKRLQRRRIKASKERVNRVMRENNLLSVTRPKPERKVNNHTGSITTELPNRMWGTDGKKFYTQKEGWCWFFGIIDHFNDEIISWHASKSGNRFNAMEPLRTAVKKTYGSLEQNTCKGIGLFLSVLAPIIRAQNKIIINSHFNTVRIPQTQRSNHPGTCQGQVNALAPLIAHTAGTLDRTAY